MKISENGLNLIKNFEGFRGKEYRDVGGKWTIGYGHLIKDGESFDKGVTLAEALQLLDIDLDVAENAVNKLVKVSLTQGQFDATVSLVYNWGIGNFQRSEGLQKLNSGDYDGAWDEFEEVIRVNGRVIAGLVRRRDIEEDVWDGETLTCV